jgi:hypothetical protein
MVEKVTSFDPFTHVYLMVPMFSTLGYPANIPLSRSLSGHYHGRVICCRPLGLTGGSRRGRVTGGDRSVHPRPTPRHIISRSGLAQICAQTTLPKDAGCGGFLIVGGLYSVTALRGNDQVYTKQRLKLGGALDLLKRHSGRVWSPGRFAGFEDCSAVGA